ncbi:hypothetical protein LEP1GSC073_0666 [Leptospira noguchii str. Cascata]|nr:hypothetical protein LEP1GSC073_0666 [Leptospira noguchii str. Cascata]
MSYPELVFDISELFEKDKELLSSLSRVLSQEIIKTCHCP